MAAVFKRTNSARQHSSYPEIISSQAHSIQLFAIGQYDKSSPARSIKHFVPYLWKPKHSK